MFQDLALFPHMNVAENITFGLRMKGIPHDQRQARLAQLMQLVGLIGMEQRDVTQLSGGERQRVALARSLAPGPHLLMLDEPLGSLDAALRERLMVDLRAIIKQVGLTAIYVTHDQQEAYAIADRIAILNRGLIEQVDTPEQIYRRPSTTFVARFLGLNNIVPVQGCNGSGLHSALGDFSLPVSTDALLLHPQGIRLVSNGAPGSLAGIVEERIFQGEHYRLVVRFLEGTRVTFSEATSAPGIGESVSIQVNPSMVLPLKSSD
jgi:ABC-type Fe3+/spermidine/putrescine transport system ATPase subunit